MKIFVTPALTMVHALITFTVLVGPLELFAASEVSEKLHSLEKDIQSSQFHGFEQLNFKGPDGAHCRLVLPEKPAEGNPWVWRARFWGHQPDFDKTLLARGYHVAYCDVANLYGSKKAVERWDEFYGLATKIGLGEKPILEGMSRGGLIIFNWAKANPDRVTAIYGDNPVCDIRSWPKGTGADWTRCKEVYDITDDDLATFEGNPIDGLKPLAEAGVPVFLVLGEADNVVPIKDNALVLKERYEALGGRVHYWVKPGLNHHPHGLKPALALVDAITEPSKPLPIELLKDNAPILILGDSITYQGDYMAWFSTWAQQEHGIDPSNFINAGLSSETASGLSEPGHAGGKFPRPDIHERLDRVLAEIKPKLILANYGMNCGILLPLDQQRFDAYRQGITKLKKKAEEAGSDILFITPPTFDGARSPGKAFYSLVLDQYSRWLLDQTSQSWKVIDAHFPMALALRDMRAKDPKAILQPDCVHPNALGHQIMAEAIIRGFDPSFKRSRFETEAYQNAYRKIVASMGQVRDTTLKATGHLRPGVAGYRE